MRFGLVNGVSAFPGQDHRPVVEFLTEQAQFADRHGFAGQWIAERHFTPFTASGAPSVILGHLAAQTSRLQLGYSVGLLALTHPIRFAEEVAWVDTLSQGRVVVGVGPGGSPQEYQAFGVPAEERKERFAESLQIVRKALAGESFTWEGRFFTLPELQIFPTPQGWADRPIYLACSSREHVAWAASLDAIPLFGLRTIDELRAQLQVYQEARAALGDSDAVIATKRAQIGQIRRIMIADTRAEAIRLAEESQQALLAGMRYVTGQPADAPITPRYERADVLAGTVDEVREGLDEISETGIGLVLLSIGAGGLGTSFDVQRRNLEAIADVISRAAPHPVPPG